MKKRWTEAEKIVLARLYPDAPMPQIIAALGRSESSIRNQVNQQGLRRSRDFLESSASGRVIKGCLHPSMVASRFKPGHKTWNKGAAYNPGGRAPQTQFKPGHKPPQWLPIGAESVNRDGIPTRKVAETGNRYVDWKRIDEIEWVAANGPIPKGRRLVVIDKTKPRTLDNLKPMTRAEVMKRNSYHENYPPEVARLMQLKGAIQRQVNRIAKESK
jgi:hypothetical protein